MKRYIIGFVLLTLSVSYTFAEQKGLVLYYSFDKVEENTIRDLSGNNNHIHLNTPCSLVEGKKESALYFDGGIGFSIPHNSSLTFKDGLTISFWLRMDTDGVRWLSFVKKVVGLSEKQSFANNPTAYVPFKGFNFGSDGSSSNVPLEQANFRLTVEDEGNREEVKINIARHMEKGKWVHLTGTYNPDPKNRGLCIYVNGKLIADVVMITMPTDISNSGPLIIGKDLTGLNGAMDELRIYNHTLSIKEVEELFMSYQ